MLRETVIETGRIMGVACGWPSITAYFGIPYAAPPVGELRWRAPQRAAAWEGVRDCARPSARCPQLGVGRGSFYEKEFYPTDEPMDEDCLYLNVWTPAQSADEKLPVIFWVHGGVFLTGYGHSAHFDGESFARRGVILVTINYRLNIFGWMVHPELDAESEHGVSGNYGLLDQIAALEWVHRNINAFGGDPERVTIAGQSAGAMSIHTLLTTPLTRGLVSGAIMQSGGGVTPMPDMRYPSLAEAEAETDLGLLGVSSIEEARRLPWRDLLDRWALVRHMPGLIRKPVQDGWVLPASLDEMAAAGDYRHVPCIIGFTSEEGIPAGRSYDEWHKLLAAEYGPEGAEEFAAVTGGREGFEAYCRRHFTTHCRAAAEAWALLRERQGTGDTYIYCFNRRLPGDDMGAFHAADLWYVFWTLGRCWRPWTGADYELADACCGYWAGFAKSGRPQGVRLPGWRPYTAQDPAVMELGTRVGEIRLPEDPAVAYRRDFLLSGRSAKRR
ncbi:MAG: carboxylesterase family protein [Lachnospiraceae bacterium]|nr:carboxylesterase family protein [Lachnospiraceae bacterium]